MIYDLNADTILLKLCTQLENRAKTMFALFRDNKS